MRRPLEYIRVFTDEATVRASDGSQRELRAGSMCLLEDTHGKGHLTTILGDEEVVIVAVRIPDDELGA